MMAKRERACLVAPGEDEREEDHDRENGHLRGIHAARAWSNSSATAGRQDFSRFSRDRRDYDGVVGSGRRRSRPTPSDDADVGGDSHARLLVLLVPRTAVFTRRAEASARACA